MYPQVDCYSERQGGVNLGMWGELAGAASKSRGLDDILLYILTTKSKVLRAIVEF